MGVISLASDALSGAALSLCQEKDTGEHDSFWELHDVFVVGDLILADSYYRACFLIAAMQNQGVGVLFEQHGRLPGLRD